MRAATIAEGAVTVQEHEDPAPAGGEVLVRVRAAGINGADLLQRKGRYPAPPGAPADIPGLELAGEVVGLGPGASRFKEGDRVFGIVGGGGQAELAAVHERQLMPIPETLDWPEAGGVPEVFTTAHDALFAQAGLRMGEQVLVHGAAGGVGTAAVQLGCLAGARVTATVRNPDAWDTIAELGAEEVRPHDAFAGTGPYDVILELVGAPNLRTNLDVLNTGGRISIIGVGAGPQTDINLLALMGKRAKLMGSTLRARPLEEKAATARRLEAEVLPHLSSGRLRVPIAETFHLDDVDAAYHRFAAGGKIGKVVLVF